MSKVLIIDYCTQCDKFDDCDFAITNGSKIPIDCPICTLPDIDKYREVLKLVKDILQKAPIYYDAHVMYENIKLAITAIDKLEVE
jgi:ABC-type molybdate transport system ATPase subunit